MSTQVPSFSYLCTTLSSWSQSQLTSPLVLLPCHPSPSLASVAVCSQLGKSSVPRPFTPSGWLLASSPLVLRAPSTPPFPMTPFGKGPVHPPKLLSWDEGLLGWVSRYRSRLRDVEEIGGGKLWIWGLPDSSLVLPSRGKFKAGERNSWC